MKKSMMLVWLMFAAMGGLAQSLPPAPSVPASALSFSNVYCNRVNVNWVSGDGQNRIVVVKKASAVVFSPTDSNYYKPEPVFGSKPFQDLGTDEYVVFNGTASSVIVSGLESNTTYHVKVYESNGSGVAYSFLRAGAPTGSFTTASFEPSLAINVTRQCNHEDTFVFSGSVTSSLSNPVTYSWNFGDNVTAVGDTVQHSYNKYGKFTVTMVANSTGCRDTVTALDTVVPLPIISPGLDPDSIGMDTIQCFYNADGSQHSFAFNGGFVPQSYNFGSNNTVFSWDFGDGTGFDYGDAFSFVRRKTYAEPGVYRVRFRASLRLGTEQTGCVDSADFYVQVKPRPLDSNLIYFSDTSMCLSWNSFDFQNRNGVPGSSRWTLGDGYTLWGDSVTHSYAAAGRYGVRLDFWESTGAMCYDFYEDTVELVPPPDNWFIGLKPKYCLGDAPELLRPNLSGGTFKGINVNAVDSTFTPAGVGFHRVQYIYEVGGCLDTAEQTTWVHNMPVIDLGPDTVICEGGSFQIDLPLDTGAILWHNGSIDSFYLVSGPGLVWARKTNGHCTFGDTLNVTELKAPLFELGPDTTLCGDGEFHIVLPPMSASLVWEDGSDVSERYIRRTGRYYVTATNKCGIYSDTVDVEVLGGSCDIQMPNAFSPNGDEINPVFRASGRVDVISMKIFNRWGELLFESQGLNPSWDGTYQGKVVPEGVYFFEVIYLKPEGNELIPTAISEPLYILY